MSSSVSQRLGGIVRTQLLFARPTSAAVKFTVGDKSHVMTAKCERGRFVSLSSSVDAVLGVWFHEVFGALDGQDFARAVSAVTELVRERHEAQLPQPPDPRRLALTLG